MKADVSVLTFKNSLNKVSKVASKHLSLPILSCLLIRAENERMYISATNLELGVEVSLPAKIETPGTIAVQADVITNIISQIKDDTHLTIELNSDGNLVLNSKLFKGTLNIVDHEDFPTIPSIQNPTGSLNIKSSEFTNVCKSVLYSGSVSSIKPELSSVLFYIDDNNLLTAVTTDLFRLAEKKVSFIKQQSFDKVLISIKNIIEIIRIIGEGKSDIEILVKDNQVVCLVDDVYIISRTVDSNFPDYKQIIPKEYKTEVVLLKNGEP